MMRPRLVKLRDGSAVQIRPIRPEDRELLVAGFSRLSQRSRYLRFQGTTTSLSESQLSYLTIVDHHDHEALVAVEPADGDLVGVARFVRVGAEVAECAIVVADDWQGRGLGSELLDRLVDRAREEGVARFSALVLAENDQALRLLERLGDVARRSYGPQVELDIALPEPEAEQSLRELLRGAASGVLSPTLSMWRLVADFAYRRRAPAAEVQANAIVVHVLEDAEAPGLRAAAALAEARAAHLHLVDGYWPVLSDREEAQQRLEASAAELRRRRLAVSVHLRAGDTVDVVVDVAQESRAALIVIDAGASSIAVPWRPYAMSDRVCARAPCDVLIAR